MKRSFSIALAFLVLTIWAFAYVVIRVTVKDGTIPPFTLSLIRFSVAMFVLELIPIGKNLPKPDKKDTWTIYAMGFFGIFLFFAFENYGLIFTTATNASILVSLVPISTMVGAMLLFKQKVTALNWVGMILAFAGSTIVVLNGKLNFHLNPLGDFLIAMSTLIWAIYTIIGKNIVEKYDPVVVTRGMLRCGTVMFIPFAAWEYAQGMCSAITPISMLGVLYLGVMCTVVAFILWNRLMGELGIVFVSNLLYSQCVFTAVCAWLTIGERVTWMMVGGTLLLLAGVYLTNRKAGENGVAE